MVRKSDVELISQIQKGRQRRQVFKFVDEKPKIVSQIMKEVNTNIKTEDDGKPIRLADVSRTLKFLTDNKLVECLNPAERGDSGILYQLTKKGLELKKHI